MTAIKAKYKNYWLDKLRTIVAHSRPSTNPQEYVGKFVTIKNGSKPGIPDPEALISDYCPTTRRWKLTWDPLWPEQTGITVPPAWVDAHWLKTHGPADINPPGYDRSSNDELIINYLRTAHPDPAWFLLLDSGYMQRWHARCIASSDFAAVRAKCRPANSGETCACGAATENTEHVHLHCPLYANLRQPFLALLDAFTRRVNETQPAWYKKGQIRSREEALRWVHHNHLLLFDHVAEDQLAPALRHAALVLHSQIQRERFATGRFHHQQPPSVEYMVHQEDAHLLAPFTAQQAEQPAPTPGRAAHVTHPLTQPDRLVTGRLQHQQPPSAEHRGHQENAHLLAPFAGQEAE